MNNIISNNTTNISNANTTNNTNKNNSNNTTNNNTNNSISRNSNNTNKKNSVVVAADVVGVVYCAVGGGVAVAAAVCVVGACVVL